MSSNGEPLDPYISALVARARATQLPRPSERRRLRQNARLTFREMGRALHVDPMTVLRWEKGTVSPRPEHAAAYGRLLAALEEALQ